MPRIAFLGWGSLLWDGGAQFDRWHEEWLLDGPVVKIEFSRISSSRLNALTLVVDLEHGVDTQVAWCLSRRSEIDDAVEDLRSREGTTLPNIGQVLPNTTQFPNEQPARAIATWAGARKLDAVVWTQLAGNFESFVKRPFSVREAVAYIRRLPPEGKSKAAEYILSAPDFVRTPVRMALQNEPWFIKYG